MSKTDDKKKKMATKMGSIDMSRTSNDMMRRGNQLDNTGKLQKSKDSIKNVGAGRPLGKLSKDQRA